MEKAKGFKGLRKTNSMGVVFMSNHQLYDLEVHVENAAGSYGSCKITIDTKFNFHENNNAKLLKEKAASIIDYVAATRSLAKMFDEMDVDYMIAWGSDYIDISINPASWVELENKFL